MTIGPVPLTTAVRMNLTLLYYLRHDYETTSMPIMTTLYQRHDPR